LFAATELGFLWYNVIGAAVVVVVGGVAQAFAGFAGVADDRRAPQGRLAA
jgi:hypothetical protein